MRKRNLQLAMGILVMCFFASPWLRAQIESGSITGQVTDSQGAAVADATVTVTKVGTGISVLTKTNNNGSFGFSTLHPSQYKVTVQKEGFKAEVNPDVDLHVQDKLSVNFTLTVGSSNETITVSASSGANLETSAAVTTTVDRQFVENMPLNGRSFQALIALTPGNVTAKTYYTNSGQFSVNGQRTDANYFSIDGVSANVGITQGSNVYLGSAGAGAQQATSNNGGYNSLVSIDDMQEYKIQTSSFDPEYGRTPGAQLSIVTRSGTNQFHGTAFEYLHNEVFDANNWFNNNAGLPRAAEKQNDFGGVIGGPIWRDKLFFFFSYEGLRLRVPESRQDIVPSTSLRALADSTVGPLLDAYPLPSHGLSGYPNNDQPGDDTAIFATTFSNPSTLNATSLRLDYTISPKLNVFVRGDYTPSNGAQYGAFDFYTRSTLSHTIANVDTETAGLTYAPTNTLVNDFRFNLSHAKGATVVNATDFGGATIPSDAYLFQSNPTCTTATSVFAVFFNDGSTDYYVGNDATNHQRQLNFIDTLSWAKGRHNMKFGVDYRRLTPTNGYRPWDISYDFDSFAAVLTHVPVYAGIDTTDTSELRPVFYDLSLFAQDSWQVSPRLTLTYGLRWDYDPPPGEDSGHPFFTALNLNDPPNVALAPDGTPLWYASKHGQIFIQTNWKASNGTIMVADVAHPEPERWQTLIPEDKSATAMFRIAGHKLLVNYMNDAHSQLRLFDENGKAAGGISLPGMGSVVTIDSNWKSPIVCFSYSSFQTPTTFFSYSVSSGKDGCYLRPADACAAGRCYCRSGLVQVERRHAHSDVPGSQKEFREERQCCGASIWLWWI